jgi:hypothetical protein
MATKVPKSRTKYKYNFIVRPNLDSHPYDGEASSGTLKDAIELAEFLNAKIVLTDEAGFVKGYVHPDGNYSLR